MAEYKDNCNLWTINNRNQLRRRMKYVPNLRYVLFNNEFKFILNINRI